MLRKLVLSAVALCAVTFASAASALVSDTPFPAGSKVSVQWKDKWYDAAVKSVDTAKSCWNIHYDGYEASWDECVGKDRIKARGGAAAAAENPHPNGAKVQVLWKGKWYPAAVKTYNEKKKCWNIHYDGYADSWD